MNDRFVETLDLICERPALYLGTTSLSVLYGWVLGWNDAFEIRPDNSILTERDFGEFVKAELGYFEGTLGWRRIILKSCGDDEEAAFSKFVELYKRFKYHSGWGKDELLSPTATNNKA